MADEVTSTPAPNLTPKRTRKTDGFKIMLASWLVTIAVTQLNKRHVLIPDFLQDYTRDTLVTLIDTAMIALSGWLTHLVVKSSLARNVANTEAAHSAGVPDVNVAKMEVTQK